MAEMTLEQKRALAIASARMRAASASGAGISEQPVQAGQGPATTPGYDLARQRAMAAESRFPSGATDMLLRPFADNISGAADALMQGAKNVPAYLSGRPPQISMGDAYRAGADVKREALDTYAGKYPNRSLALELLGGAAIGPGKSAEMSGIGRVASNIGTAGALGGVYGAAGNDSAPVAGAGFGATVGAGLGAILPVVGTGVRVASGAKNAIMDALGPRASVIPEEVSTATARRASRHVSSLLDATGKDVQALRAPDANALPQTAAEAIGRPGVADLGALGRRSGKTPDALEALLRERADAMPDRIMAGVANATGLPPEAARGDINSLVQKLSEEARPLYEQAYATPTPVTQKLKGLATRPSVRRAMKAAANVVRDAGRDPAELGFPFDGTGAVMTGREAPSRVPTTEAWDLVKRQLDNEVQKVRDPITGRLTDPVKGASLTSLSSELRAALREANPSYAAALDRSGEYLRLEQAFKDGGQYIASGERTPEMLAARLAKLSAAEREAIKGGMVNNLYDLAQKGRLTPRTFNSPRFQKKLAVAFGQDAATSIIANAEREAAMARTGGRMMPGANSVTAETLLAAGEQNRGIPGADIALSFGRDIAGGRRVIPALASAAARGAGQLGVTLRNPTMTTPTRDEIGRLLMMSPKELADYLQVMNTLPRGTAPMSPLGLAGAVPSSIESRN